MTTATCKHQMKKVSSGTYVDPIFYDAGSAKECDVYRCNLCGHEEVRVNILRSLLMVTLASIIICVPIGAVLALLWYFTPEGVGLRG